MAGCGALLADVQLAVLAVFLQVQDGFRVGFMAEFAFHGGQSLIRFGMTCPVEMSLAGFAGSVDFFVSFSEVGTWAFASALLGSAGVGATSAVGVSSGLDVALYSLPTLHTIKTMARVAQRRSAVMRQTRRGMPRTFLTMLLETAESPSRKRIAGEESSSP